MAYIIKKIDEFLDAKTMYQLAFQGLCILACISVVFGFLGIIAYGGVSLIGSLVVLCAACYLSNYIFAKIVSAARNFESVFITALILFFIVAPATTIYGYGILIFASIIAMASKYVLAIHMKHIFNPAAISAFILGVCGIGSVIWWVATASLLPFVLIIGVLILRKINKFTLFFTFAGVASMTIIGFALHGGVGVAQIAPQIFVSWPLLFFGMIMLTEPLSTPPSVAQQTIYGAFVGFLFGAQFSFGPIFSTPELALVVGNIYTFIVSPKYFAKLVLREKREIAPSIYEFVFSSARKLSNIPGQYLEWTLPHAPMDNRGTRRYFTVASSPTEDSVKIGVRMATEKSSSFKKHLLDMKAGDTISATSLSGHFTLPKDTKKKIVLIAGGIGITPFRSMIQYLIDMHEHRDITLVYSNKAISDIVYKDIFKKAEGEVGLRTLYVINEMNADISAMPDVSRTIDAPMIKTQIPDYMDRTFYLSGPPGMVKAYGTLLQSMGVSSGQIMTDFFPGFN